MKVVDPEDHFFDPNALSERAACLEELILDRLRYQYHFTIERRQIRTALEPGPFGDSVIGRICFELAGLRRQAEFWWYASWWDYSRAYWFPALGWLGRWALKRWPPHVIKARVDVSLLFPEAFRSPWDGCDKVVLCGNPNPTEVAQ